MKTKSIYTVSLLFCICIMIIGCSGSIAEIKNENEINNYKATLVLKNGIVYSMEDEEAVYEAIAVNEDEIVYVGSNEEAEKYISKITNVIDLKGNTVIPGIVATGINVSQNVLERLYSVYLNDCQSNDEYIDVISQYVKKYDTKEIIIGRGWKDEYYSDGLGPKKEALDNITEDVPIILRSSDGLSVWLNSKALQLAGITEETEDVEGGIIERYNDGTPSGTLRNNAISLTKSLYMYSPYTIEQYEYAYIQFQNYMNSIGVTTVQNMQNLYIDSEIEIESIDTLNSQSSLHVRQSNVMHITDYSNAKTTIENLAISNKKYNSEYVKLNTVKITLDGAYVSNTCFMSSPYKNSNYYGEKFWSDEELYEVLKLAISYNVNIQISAEGSGAVKQALDAIAKVKAEDELIDANITIADINFLDKKDIIMLDDLHVNASFDLYSLEYQLQKRDEVYGEDSEMALLLLDELYKLDMNVSTSIQNLEEYLEPLQFIENVVTTYDDVSVYNIVSSLTKMAAFEIGMDDMVGTLETNKKADLIVVNKDIFNIDKESIDDTQIIYTISNGEVVY